MPRTPEQQRDRSRYILPYRPGSEGKIGPENRLDIDYLLICPWMMTGGDRYTILYGDVMMLAEDGTLVIVIHASDWGRCHDQRVAKE